MNSILITCIKINQLKKKMLFLHPHFFEDGVRNYLLTLKI
jgi:hypothetical protein